MKNIQIFVCCAMLLGLSLPVYAGMYKWVDAEGHVHYSQKPPPKEGTRTSIDTSKFNSVAMVKAPPIPKRTVRRSNTQPAAPAKRKSSGCPYR